MRQAGWARVGGLVAALCLSTMATAIDARSLLPNEEAEQFIREMVDKRGLDETRVRAVLGDAKIRQSILDAISRPAEAKPWYAYRKIFVTPTRIEKGIAFMRRHADTLMRAEEKYGVPREIMTAIIGVETLYGEYRLRIRVVDALATLGFHYPRRAKFFRRELGEFLTLTREEQLDALAINGSYAGAIGVPQFIPSSYRAYAVDFDGDGKRDLAGSFEDAIGSVGAYLARHGWQRGQAIAVPAKASRAAVERFVAKRVKPKTPMGELESNGVSILEVPRGTVDDTTPAQLIDLQLADGREAWVVFKNFYAITRYNTSKLYALAVYQLAERIREGAGQ
jgi:membrane-bound lytic murein transglycosylase B